LTSFVSVLAGGEHRGKSCAMQGLDGICSFLSISDSCGTAGQPTPAQFADVKAAGYEVVVNLAMPNSSNALANERELVTGQGMEYVHLPVVWENPTDADLDTFFRVMAGYQSRKVFVHCALNYRVSAFMLLHRVIVQGVSFDEAKEALNAIWEPNETWRSFISHSLARYGVEI
jgi:protein tyrosine phosphatase (PTP) superfamily phosphohydrolase (DUF442 family)